VLIRDAAEGDLAAIAAIFNHVMENSTAIWSDQPADVDERRLWLAARRERGWAVLVAEDESGEIAGFASCSQFRAAPGYSHTMENSVHVAAGRRGAGVGRALLEALIERAAEGGAHVMVAAVGAENTGSIAFHERLGFREVGRMPEIGRKAGRWQDLVLMQRELG
jgi:phosphinothricin acetyltransferase